MPFPLHFLYTGHFSPSNRVLSSSILEAGLIVLLHQGLYCCRGLCRCWPRWELAFTWAAWLTWPTLLTSPISIFFIWPSSFSSPSSPSPSSSPTQETSSYTSPSPTGTFCVIFQTTSGTGLFIILITSSSTLPPLLLVQQPRSSGSSWRLIVVAIWRIKGKRMWGLWVCDWLIWVSSC